MKYTRQANNVKITPIEDGKKYKVDFDFLDENEGFVIKLLVSAWSTTFRGKVKGVRQLKYARYVRKLSYWEKPIRFFGFVLALVALFMFYNREYLSGVLFTIFS